jgi:hypothetical protein
MSLTNNWNPQPSDSIVNSPDNLTARWATEAINVTAQRNFLSNQYGLFLLCGNDILLTPNKVGWTFMYESLRPSRITANFTSMKPSSTLLRITRPKSYPAMSTSPISFHGMCQRNPPYLHLPASSGRLQMIRDATPLCLILQPVPPRP